MHVLVIKLSSMGDVLHTLPAITECLAHVPDLKIDWVVEPAFKEIIKWHPGVQEVYAFPLRAARKNPKIFFSEMPKIVKKIREKNYDLVIDAQGLIKSALLAKLVKSRRIVGLNKQSSREPLASRFYHQGYSVSWSLHAVMRVKTLFSSIFSYPLSSEINYRIDKQLLAKPHSSIDTQNKAYAVFLHGTTWETKHWPETYWQELIQLCCQKNPDLDILLPFGSAEELARAQRLSTISAQVKVLPKLSLTELAYFLANAKFVVAVDTGLGHLAAALGTQTVNLYGPTDPDRTGTRGPNQVHLAANQIEPSAFPCSPCLKRVCVYAKAENSVMPPCYQVIHPKLVMERLSE